MRTNHIIGGALLAALLVGAAFWLFPSEKRRVERQFARLAERVSKESGESVITMGLKMNGLRDLFDNECAFDTNVDLLNGSFTRDEVMKLAASSRDEFATLSLEFSNLRIEFPAGDRAAVQLTATLKGAFPKGDKAQESHEVKCTLKKVEQDWRFSACTVTDLEQP